MCMGIYVHICMCMCMHVYVYVYVCIYIYIYYSSSHLMFFYVVFESMLLNYANPCRNWTFKRFARAAQKKCTFFFPQHITIPMNTVCHSQLIHSFLQSQHQVLGPFQSLSCTPHIALTMDLTVLRKIHISLSLSHHVSLPYCQPYITLINSPFQLSMKSSTMLQLTTLPKLMPTAYHPGSHSSLTSTTCTHPVTKICEFQYVST